MPFFRDLQGIMTMKSALFTGFLAMILASTGCGGGATVSGNVTTKGEKVTSGNVTFSPVGKGNTVTATISADGTYSARDVGLGKNNVVFAPASSAEPVVLKPGETAKPAPFSGLQTKVSEVDVKSGENKIDIELVPKKII